MAKVDLKAFVRALKRAGRKRQVVGFLFALDKKNNDLCACALGQGLLESGLVDEEEVKTRLKSKGTFREATAFNQIGISENIPVLVDDDLEGAWMSKLRDMYGDEFVTEVYGENDTRKASISNIVSRLLIDFREQLNS